MTSARTLLLVAFLVVSLAALAAEQRGQVLFNGLPVPGATVTATQSGKQSVTVTDVQGGYRFADLADGSCTIQVEMSGFAVVKQEVRIGPQAAASVWELRLLPLDQINARVLAPPVKQAAAPPGGSAEAEAPKPQAPASATPPPDDDEMAQRAADGLLINGSANNGAASAFGQEAAFGNNRNGGRQLYNGGIGFVVGNSALDARSYSLTGQSAPKPAYSRVSGSVTFGGPLPLRKFFRSPPNIFVGYQWSRTNSAITQTALMPTAAERSGVLSGPVIDPLTGTAFAGNTIPQDRLSPQAQALLALYPLPNVTGNPGYNYQVPVVTPTHQDALQSRFMKSMGSKNAIFGNFAFLSTRSAASNVFGFVDRSRTKGINLALNWNHSFRNTLFATAGYQFSRFTSSTAPYFQNRRNVSGDAGIAGNNQEARNWGPPRLVFSGGTAELVDGQSSEDRVQTSGGSYSMLWNHRGHNVTLGGDFRRRQYNARSQQDPRGAFTFTGAQSGSAFGDFLLGLPDTLSIADGNADKYFRQSMFDAYLADDWRMNSSLTLNLGVRWDYATPMTELKDRLVNLDLAPGFTAASPVVASNPTGALTQARYPESLLRPDHHGFAPRVGLAWRPIPGSSTVVRAGYGIYFDTSVYQTIATQMAQQPPLSRTFSIQNNSALTLANGFTAAATAASNTFAVDPDFRVGYAQNWTVSLQHSLPASLQVTASYLGIKGTHAVQAILPNTYPVGAANPCASCPSGFVFVTSGANSSRHAAQVQLRRRLRSGLAGSLQYTFSKSMDDAAVLGGLGGSASSQGNSGAMVVMEGPRLGPASLDIAQDWRNLLAERALSDFDQRHLLSAQMQYTPGVGLGGGALLGGWQGALFKDWTFSTQITAGSGLPQTPLYLAAVPGTGITGTIRPDLTGAPLYAAPAGVFVNPAAFAAPAPGQWGNARRNSITGPAQFGLNAALSRTFRLKDRYSLDFRLESVNALNHPTYTAWNTVINSAQFGLPVAANAMRSLQTSLRARF
ncbi:MAG TPA: TonB-dependent receptor [Terriglobales bacterium]|nr:TonB-dependent receptor [Terriglobales bacterium]